MAQARYEVLIPPGALAQRALEHVSRELPGQVSIEHEREVWEDGMGSYYDVLHVTTEESPHADSTVKQLAVYVAEASGTSPIVVSKQGQGGIQVWPMQYKNN
jgi:hypothetical protein